MERPGRWTFVAIALYLSFQDTACQIRSNMVSDTCAMVSGNPSSTDLYNSILTTAACNGVLPDLIPMLQNQPIVETLAKCPYPQEMLTKPLSVVPMTSAQDPIIFSNQPLRPPASNQNILLTTPLSCGPCGPPIKAMPQSISAAPLPSSTCISPIAQVVPVENYPACAPNIGVVQPKPIVLQPQNQCNEINSYFNNQIAEPVSLPDVSSSLCNLPVLPPISASAGTLEITSNLAFPCLPQPTVLTNDCSQTPLQINFPTSLPVPKVTVVSTGPPNSPNPISFPCFPDYASNLPPFPYPPQPPIIIESSKSSWKKILPILLLALLTDRGCNDGNACSRCCCSCSGGGNNIPIPYPIPIPINNPVINTCSSSHNRDNKEDIDDEDDRKRK